MYYADNFNIIRNAINALEDEGKLVEKAKATLRCPKKLRADLTFLKANFEFLIATIKKLETKGLPLSEAIGMMQSTRARLREMEDKQYSQKLESVLRRNVGFTTLVEINRLIRNNSTALANADENEFVHNLTPAQISSFQYCPVTSCDVERVFSNYKYILRERRRNFLLDNLMLCCCQLQLQSQ